MEKGETVQAIRKSDSDDYGNNFCNVVCNIILKFEKQKQKKKPNCKNFTWVCVLFPMQSVLENGGRESAETN